MYSAIMNNAATEADRARDREITQEKISSIAKGDMKAAEEAFQQQFPGSDMKSMTHLGEHYGYQFFLLDNLRIVGLETFRGPSFFEIERVMLSSKGATCLHNNNEASTKNNVELITDDGVITYELYPFEQGYEVSLEILLKVLGLDATEVQQLETENEDSDDGSFLCRVDDATTIHVSDDQVYSICKNDEIVSACRGPDYEYQLGPDTRCFFVKKKDMLIIDNRGDVSSVIVVHFSTGVILM
jgi:hypothetical protein